MGRRNDKVKGYCPQGCGETLFLGDGGHVTCSFFRCPNPASVDELLGDWQNTMHVVSFDQGGSFAIQHPVRERQTLGTDLYLCPLHEFLKRNDAMPMGRYQAECPDSDGNWFLTKLD